MLKAKCLTNVDPWGDHVQEELKEGEVYQVAHVSMGQWYTSVNINGEWYNSLMFDFYEDETLIDIYDDPRYNPYI